MRICTYARCGFTANILSNTTRPSVQPYGVGLDCMEQRNWKRVCELPARVARNQRRFRIAVVFVWLLGWFAALALKHSRLLTLISSF